MSIIRQRRRVWLAFVLLSWPTIAIGLVSSVETERIRAAIHVVEASIAQETAEARKQAALENAYSDASIAEVKNRIIEIAFELGAPGAEEFMLRVLQHDPDVRLRIAAVNALARHGSKKSIPLLFRCARSDPGGMGGWDCTRYPATPRR